MLEFIIALTLAILLLTLLITLYLSFKRTYHYIQAINTIQEDELFLNANLHNEIQEAGYIGCVNQKNVSLKASYLKIPFNQDYIIHSFDEPLPDINSAPDSDNLVIQSIPSMASLIRPIANQDTIYLPRSFIVKPKQILLISDCAHAELFSVKQIVKLQLSQMVITSEPLQFSYSKTAQVGKLSANYYYVADSHRTDQQGKPIYSLYLQDLYESKYLQDEILSGVVKMKIYYAVNINPGGQLTLVTATQVNQRQLWDRVLAVEIKFLLSNGVAILFKPQAYNFDGQLYQANNNQYYQSWELYAALRERVH